jgi:hypothetical protein
MDLVITVLLMLGYSPAEHTRCHHYRRAAKFAEAISRVYTRIEPTLPANMTIDIVAATGINESSGVWRIGRGGEVGWMQIHPAGRGKTLCSDLNVWRPDDNIECGIRLLVAAQNGGCDSEPEAWLGRYNGWQRCGSTPYAQRVVARIHDAVVGRWIIQVQQRAVRVLRVLHEAFPAETDAVAANDHTKVPS